MLRLILILKYRGVEMKLYSKNNFYKLYQGNMLEMLDDIEENSIDSVVTDPPYELNFMNKGWDNAGVSFQSDTWKKCFEVLKPGGYLLAFGGSRTFHRIACAIEDAGFEIRDTIMWLYGSGFPKSMNIGLAIDKKNGLDNRTGNIVKGQGVKDNNKNLMKINCNEEYEERIAQNKWQGWGTCLKPSFEPIIVARKPFKGSLVDNIEKYGVGGINIDECRVGTEKVGGGTMPDFRYVGKEQQKLGNGNKLNFGQVSDAPRIECEEHEGRFPANTILTYDETDFDEVCGSFPKTKQNGSIKNPNLKNSLGNGGIYNKYSDKQPLWESYKDSGSASRYFYCAKASKKDRDEGLDNFIESQGHAKGNGLDRVCEFCGVSQLTPELCHCETKSWVAKPRKNTHPTVKPCDLMQYLVRLVTPNGGIVLDPFNGSGSTGKAVMYENKERNKNYKYVGIEITEDYLPIAKARIEYVCKDLETIEESLDLSDLD